MRQDKDKENRIEVHERIQLAIGIKTCPVEYGENQLKPEIYMPGVRTLNLFGGVFEADASEGLS